jgi:lysophospholipase L1-like esterase
VLVALLGWVSTGRLAAQEPANRFEKDIAVFEEQDRKQAPEPGGVLFLGSSSIRMWETAKAFPDVRSINRGFGGSQIADSVHFADRVVVPYKPRLVVFYAGDNDISSGKSAEQVLADFKALVGKIQTALPETRVAFISIKPSLSRWNQFEAQKKANGLIREFIRSDKRMSYIDVVPPMLGGDGQPRPELYKQDRLHMTEEGYVIWNRIVGPYLKEVR